MIHIHKLFYTLEKFEKFLICKGYSHQITPHLPAPFTMFNGLLKGSLSFLSFTQLLKSIG